MDQLDYIQLPKHELLKRLAEEGMAETLNRIADEAAKEKEKNTMTIFECFLVKNFNVMNQYQILDIKHLVAHTNEGAKQQALIDWAKCGQFDMENTRVLIRGVKEIDPNEF